jgi:phosphonate transport system permease protein
MMVKRVYHLSNGKEVEEPISKVWIYVTIVFVFFILCLQFIPINLYTIRLNQLGVIFQRMFAPGRDQTWNDYIKFFPRLVEPILETLRMSFAGTVIGAIACLPLAVLSSRNVVKKPYIYQTVRTIMNFLRTIPTLVIAVVATFFFGYGVLPGIVAIAIFTFCIMTKMLYESIETVDMGPNEALEACGAKKVIAFKNAIFPQILPIYLSYFIYTFEINVRSSVILGYVGAGGIGTIINDNIGYLDRIGAIFITLFVLVSVIQMTSTYVRGKLQ